MQVEAGSTTQTDRLKQAILLYDSFATVHEVADQGKGKRPEIRPGVLATKDGLLAALRTLLPESQRGTGLIPDTTLASGVDHTVWWVKPTSRTVWFNCKDLGGERTATVPHPGLVMVTSPEGWFIFAIKGKDRPTPETKLYRTPYFNVWDDGKICTGSAKTPRGVHRKRTTAWEDAFFGSYFSHPNVHTPNGLVAKGSVYKFWKDMLDGKYSRFPEGMLVDTRLTLGSMYSRIIQKGNQ